VQKISTGDIVLFFDDDIELHPEYLERIVQVYVQHPEAAGVMGLVVNQKEYSFLQRLFRSIFLLFNLCPRGSSKIQISGYPICPVEPNLKAASNHNSESLNRKIVEPVIALWGCNMSFRHTLFDHFNFDESYDYFTDIEFGMNVASSSKLFLCRNAYIKHHRSPVNRASATRTILRQALAARCIVSQRLYGTFWFGIAHYWSWVGTIVLLFLSVKESWAQKIVAGAHEYDCEWPEAK